MSAMQASNLQSALEVKALLAERTETGRAWWEVWKR